MPTVTLTPTGCLQLTRTETYQTLDVENKAVEATGPVTHCMAANEVAAFEPADLALHVAQLLGRDLTAEELDTLALAAPVKE